MLEKFPHTSSDELRDLEGGIMEINILLRIQRALIHYLDINKKMKIISFFITREFFWGNFHKFYIGWNFYMGQSNTRKIFKKMALIRSAQG